MNVFEEIDKMPLWRMDCVIRHAMERKEKFRAIEFLTELGMVGQIRERFVTSGRWQDYDGLSWRDREAPAAYRRSATWECASQSAIQ